MKKFLLNNRALTVSLALFLLLAGVFSYMEYSNQHKAMIQKAQSETERLLYYINEDIIHQANHLKLIADLLAVTPGNQEDYWILQVSEESIDLFPLFRSVHITDKEFIVRYSATSEGTSSLVGRDMSDYPDNEQMMEKLMATGGPILSPAVWREFAEIYSAHIWVAIKDGPELVSIISGDLDLNQIISRSAAAAGLGESNLEIDIDGIEVYSHGNQVAYPVTITREIMGIPWSAAVNAEMLTSYSAPFFLGILFAFCISILYYQTNTSQKKNEEIAEALLLEKRDKELILNNLSEQVAFLDSDMRIIWANSKVIERHNLSSVEFKGHRCYEIYHDLSEPCHDCPVVKVFKTGKTSSGIHKSPDGRYWKVTGLPVFGENGEMIGAMDTALDVTDLIKSEEILQESEQRYREILESIEDGFYEVDLRGNVIDCNKAAANMLGYEEHEIKGMSYKSLCRNIETVYREFNQAFKTGEPKFSVVMELTHKKGLSVSADLSLSLAYNTHGEVTGFRGLGRDITEQKQAEQIMQARLDLMLFANTHTLDAVLQRTLDELCAIVNSPIGFYHFVEEEEYKLTLKAWSTETLAHFCKMGDTSGMSYDIKQAGVWVDCIHKRQPVIHNDYSSLPHRKGMPKDHALVFRELVVPILREGKIVGILGVGNKKQNYTEKDVHIVTYFADIAWEIAERKKAEENIYKLSFRDQLTGLYNRRYFENEIERLDNSREYPIAVISADLDGLKLVNDTIGHAEGDRYLQTGAEILKNTLRTSDILARVGGDEFALLLPHTTKEAAEALVARIRQRVEEYNLKKKELPLSISLGLAVSNGPDYTLEETYRMADNEMYNYKLQHGTKARANIVSSLLASLFERGNLAEGEREQVQELSILTGQAMGLKDDRLVNLALLAQVYDLGKVGLPDSALHSNMLSKNGGLNEAEREAIHRHPEVGYRIASASPELAGVAELILKHHENFDGSGYPIGLKGNNIPVECRIIAVAIAYSAMTNKRAYAKMLTPEEAIAELKRCAGSQFDPAVVETFLQVTS
jgi:diguanylate cyclase (GGDEF)-like protein/PAS domain S-box-containing protein